MKCQVKWIDEHGQPTPDENDAVMIAHFHEPLRSLASYSSNLIVSYSEAIQSSFPICAAHYARVDASYRFPRGGWTFTPITKDTDNSSDLPRHPGESFTEWEQRYAEYRVTREPDDERARR